MSELNLLNEIKEHHRQFNATNMQQKDKNKKSRQSRVGRVEFRAGQPLTKWALGHTLNSIRGILRVTQAEFHAMLFPNSQINEPSKSHFISIMEVEFFNKCVVPSNINPAILELVWKRCLPNYKLSQVYAVFMYSVEELEKQPALVEKAINIHAEFVEHWQAANSADTSDSEE
jgi:hypothetical protein